MKLLPKCNDSIEVLFSLAEISGLLVVPGPMVFPLIVAHGECATLLYSLLRLLHSGARDTLHRVTVVHDQLMEKVKGQPLRPWHRSYSGSGSASLI
jgi:hypothetical protein